MHPNDFVICWIFLWHQHDAQIVGLSETIAMKVQSHRAARMALWSCLVDEINYVSFTETVNGVRKMENVAQWK